MALSYERIIKNKRHKSKGKTPLDRRMYLINNLINENDIVYINNSVNYDD